MKLKQIYLAGKVKGNKWNLIEDIDIKTTKFFSSDGESKSSFTEEGGCYHGYGYVKGHMINFGGWNCPSEDIIGYTIEFIKYCNFVFVYIDSPDSYGSIAEIAYASALGKKIYMVINEFNYNPPQDEPTGDNIEFKDTYWFISNFPNVKTIFVTSEEEAKELLENLCKLESPIEEMFFDYLLKNHSYYEGKIEPQYKIGKYRIDFVIEEEKIAIELDGHDYHKTKEQRTNDASRERYLKKEGWNVIRYTGSEIFKDVKKCVNELVEIISLNKNKRLF